MKRRDTYITGLRRDELFAARAEVCLWFAALALLALIFWMAGD
jgi:hypothetical protein